MSEAMVEHYEKKMQGKIPQSHINRWKVEITKFYEMQEALRQWLDDQKVQIGLRVMYLNCGKQAWKVANKFRGNHLATELRILKFAWKERGCDSKTIDDIVEFVLKRREKDKS